MKRKYLEDFKSKLAECFKQFGQPLFLMFIVYLIGTYSIIRANFYYIDDMGRANIGYHGWTTMGRYVSEYLSYIIHANDYLADVSPLTQWIALFFLAIASICVIYLVTQDKKINFLQLVAAIPIGLSPYYLECISYKYDSPYMALSVFCSVLPLLFRNCKKRNYVLISVVSILLVCMSYQASMGIFPFMVVLLATKDWSKKENLKKIFSFVGRSVLSYIVALVIFQVFILKPVDTYVSSSILPSNMLVFGTINNLVKYYTNVWNDFEVEWLVFVGGIFISYLVVLVLNSEQKKLRTVVVGVISLVVMLMLAFGGYPFLEKPSFSSRAMYGIGVLIGCLSVMVCSSTKAVIGKLPCVFLSWSFFVFSFAYGNALYMQAEYTNFQASMIAEDLAELECVQSGEKLKVNISGNLGYAAPVQNAKAGYKMLHRLVPVTLRQKWSWGVYGLVNYYGLDNLVYDVIDDTMELEQMNCEVDNAYYSIFVDKHNVYIKIK